MKVTSRARGLGALALGVLLLAALAALLGRRTPTALGGPAEASSAAALGPEPTRAVCDGALEHRARRERLPVGDAERTFYVVPPARGVGPFPLVILFHGRGSNGQAAAERFALERTLGTPFIGLYPDGRAQPWFKGLLGWDIRDESSPDLAFFDALLAWAHGELCADRERVYVLGYSWGGGMANHVACTRSSRVRALVSVGGGGPSVPCGGPVSAMIVHGLNDPEEPIQSGRDSYATWAFAARCGTSEPLTLDGACVKRDGCVDGRRVLFCEHPGGHEWPPMLRGPALGKFLGLE